jgi:hypothetical protein
MFLRAKFAYDIAYRIPYLPAGIVLGMINNSNTYTLQNA